MVAIERLRRRARHLPVSLVIEAAEEVAAADCRLDPREQRILELIRTALGGNASLLRIEQNGRDGTR